MVLRIYSRTTADTKKHPLYVAENTWKRIPHLIQLHGTPRKRHSTINLHKLIKTKHDPKKL